MQLQDDYLAAYRSLNLTRDGTFAGEGKGGSCPNIEYVELATHYGREHGGVSDPPWRAAGGGQVV
jgi:hypothetical protein